jgi:hypothetical protein
MMDWSIFYYYERKNDEYYQAKYIVPILLVCKVD